MKNTIKCLDHEKKLIEKYLEYFPDTGLFIWKIRPNNSTYVGDIAGTLREDGYIRIILKGKRYYAHRLAYLLMEGCWPLEIDHINGVRSDNTWENLRNCNKSNQAHNRKTPSTNTTGIKGISKYGNLFRVQVSLRYKIIKRDFKDLEQAKVYLTTLREQLHGEFANHG